MPLAPTLEHILMRLADAVFDRMPAPVPAIDRAKACKIISHRGEHDNRGTMENTLAAFQGAATAGVWGLEMDVRWTRDSEPVIFHDADLQRLYGCGQTVASLPFRDLRQHFPDIPSLEEAVSRFGGKQHLMIEIKDSLGGGAQVRRSRLLEVLRPLDPVRDYHLLALRPEILPAFDGIIPQARVAVCGGWPGRYSRWVRNHRWGGICGHYLLMSGALVRNHHRYGQRIGTGYVQSRNCLYRELDRGIDWIFSNHAAMLQGFLPRNSRNGS